MILDLQITVQKCIVSVTLQFHFNFILILFPLYPLIIQSWQHWQKYTHAWKQMEKEEIKELPEIHWITCHLLRFSVYRHFDKPTADFFSCLFTFLIEYEHRLVSCQSWDVAIASKRSFCPSIDSQPRVTEKLFWSVRTT